MRYAIISDVHANESALRAVLVDAADEGAERIVCLGDVLGYGPDPVSTLELVYRRAHVCLAGNHDDAISGRCPVEDFTEFAAEAVARQRRQLKSSGIDWLAHLPHVCELDGFACAHGDFASPEAFNYVLDPADAMPSWNARPEQLLFVGHTHKPGIFLLGPSGVPHFLEPEDFALEGAKRYLVNVGSVGYPRSGVCRSSYCIYDSDAKSVRFRSLPFDLEEYAARMHGRGLHEAPWVAVRERERRRPEVRGAEDFAAPPPPKKKTSFAKGPQRRPLSKKIVKPPPPVAHLPPRTPSSAPSSAVPPPVAVREDGRGRLAPALFMAAAFLAVAGVAAAWKLASAIGAHSDETRRVAALSVAQTPQASAAPAAPASSQFGEPCPLAEDWTASFEFPGLQKAKVALNVRANETAFRLSSPTDGTVRLVKRLSLFSRPGKVFYSVRLLTTSRPGAKAPFEFSTSLAFLSEDGVLVGLPVRGNAKKSMVRKSAPVPDGAAFAELTVDCRFKGTFDLDVPHFKTEPEKNKPSQKKRRKD